MTTENVRSGREMLIDKIIKMGCYHDAPEVADFILEDRRRIVEPLVMELSEFKKTDAEDRIHRLFNSIEEVLKLAGVTP